VALEAETAPFAGAVAPVHVTGTSQFAPDHPATQVPHEYPLLPTGVQPVALWTQGEAVQPVVTGVQVGAAPLQVPFAWQVCVASPATVKPPLQL
jgi:hypothetical protein